MHSKVRGVDDHVVVAEEHHLAARESCAPIARAGGTAMCCVSRVNEAVPPKTLDDPGRLVVRPIVNDDHLVTIRS